MHQRVYTETNSSVKEELRAHPFFQHCSEEFIHNAAGAAREKPFQKGQVLFLCEDKAESFYLIRRGWVKLYRETLDGTQAVVDILTAGSMFGEMSIFDNDCYPYTAEVIENSNIIVIPVEYLKDEIGKNTQLALDMLHSLSHHCRRQDQEIEHRSLQNASQRIGCFLLRLMLQSKKDAVEIRLPYDKMLIALRLGMQPETFSRALSALKAKTGVSVKGSRIKINEVENLIEYSCKACSSKFPCKDLERVE